MSEPAAPEPPSSRRAAWTERARSTFGARVKEAEAWIALTARRQITFDFALELRNRDQDAFASVLGSAIALRLFLFTASLLVALISGLNLLFGNWGMGSALESAGVAATMVQQVETAAQAQTGRDIGFFLTGLFLALSAGRSLTKVLAACSAGAWRLDARRAKASVRTMARVTGMVALLIVAAMGLTGLRNKFGLAVATGSLALNVAVSATGWFFVTLSLPKSSRDPGAMLPGAAVFATVMTAVQWFMSFYLPRQIANASQVMGSLGVTVSSLGYLFLIGRVMAGCIVLNAVIFERFGSISGLAFNLPLVRRLPDRFPSLIDYFDLDPSVVPEESEESKESDAEV